MENFRSKSTRERRMPIENYNSIDSGSGSGRAGPTNMQDLRSYSTSHASYNNNDKEVKIKRSKSKVMSSSSLKNWSFNDPEMQRKKRVVGYKAYGVEGKMKGSFRKSFRWIKNACNHVVHGLW
ncbi:uncharacterized protein LOC132054552 [Lycium ferocissimum]|uniref:uncharacterized protein LOC132054552 n=1 Tax=Lycium ferocissimum TaxID=112874 RepID=UPI002815DCC2|nr:uncharacterized protein LOC132054552 [Lycium ferocissimum]